MYYFNTNNIFEKKHQRCRNFQIRVLERGHRQRKHKKEMENTRGRNDKTRREKRDNR